jgi:hypothetical protein
LELYFDTYSGDQRLYFERRSKQYDTDSTIERFRIIDLRTVIKAFASMFLCLPHRTTRNYKALRESIGAEIFVKGHRLEPYYVAAYAYFRLEQLFRTQAIAPNLKPARFHILMAARILAVGLNIPKMNSHDMKRYAEDLCTFFWDLDKANKIFGRALVIVTEVAAGNLDRDNIRTEPFTDRLLRKLATIQKRKKR